MTASLRLGQWKLTENQTPWSFMVHKGLRKGVIIVKCISDNLSNT